MVLDPRSRSSSIRPIACLVATAALVACSDGEEAGPGGAAAPVPLVLGASREVTTKTVPADGGRVEVAADTPEIGGFAIDVPAGAYPVARDFRVSVRPILNPDDRASMELITPLIDVENGGEHAGEPMTVTIPIAITEGDFPMAFLYHEDTARLEALPILDYDLTRIRVLTCHFSSVTVGRLTRSELQEIAYLDTGYQPGTDDFQIVNHGSYISPRGSCSGMSLASMWYFIEQRLGGEPALFGHLDNLSLPPDVRTEGFLTDDDMAIRWAAMVQTETWVPGVRDHFAVLDPEDQPVTRDERHFYATVAALLVTGEPQYIAVHRTGRKTGHAVVCYAVEKDKLWVADPNHPGEDRSIRFDIASRSFRPYSSYDIISELSELLGVEDPIGYDQICFLGRSGLVDWQEIGKYHTHTLAGDVGDSVFPRVAYRIRELTADGSVADHYEADLLGPNVVGRSSIEIALDLPDGLTARATAYRWDTKEAYDSLRIDLQEGETKIGVHVEGLATFRKEDADGNWTETTGHRFVDLEWIEIDHDPSVAPPEPEACFVYEPSDRWLMEFDHDCDGTKDSDALWHLREDGSITHHWLGLIEGYSWSVEGRTITIDVGSELSFYRGTIAEDCRHIEDGVVVFTDGRDQDSCWSARKY